MENYSVKSKIVDRQLQKRIGSGDLELPMLPGVAADVLSMVGHMDSDALALAKLIQSDQSLAGHVMRIANSAFYCPNTPLVSLQQAIARLGMSKISEIAFAASINVKTFNAPGYEMLIQRLWRHSLASALWSKEIARLARKSVEASFLCGLLHEIGKPVVMQAIVDILNEQSISLDEAEVVMLIREYQQVVGSKVAKHWKLPETVVETINYIKNYYAAPTSKDLVMIVWAGNRFASYQLEEDDVSRKDLFTLPVISDLNLYEDEVEKLLEKTINIKSAVEALSM